MQIQISGKAAEIVREQVAPEYEALDSLNEFKDTKPSQVSELSVGLDRVRPQEWPNMVIDGNFVIFGREGANSINAQPRRK